MGGQQRWLEAQGRDIRRSVYRTPTTKYRTLSTWLFSYSDSHCK
jgi:hypothetical protein